MGLTIHQVAQMLDLDRANAARLAKRHCKRLYVVHITPSRIRYEIDASDLELLRLLRQRPAR
jgi:hypothetical protein